MHALSRTSERVFRLNDCIQWRWLNGFGQEVADGSQSEELDAEGHFV